MNTHSFSNIRRKMARGGRFVSQSTLEEISNSIANSLIQLNLPCISSHSGSLDAEMRHQRVWFDGHPGRVEAAPVFVRSFGRGRPEFAEAPTEAQGTEVPCG